MGSRSPASPRSRLASAFAQKSAGASPGTLDAPPDARVTELHILAFGPKGWRELESARAEDIPDLRNEFPVVWIDVVGLGSLETIVAVGETSGMHALALEDVLNVTQRAKVEEFAEGLFAVTRMPALVHGRISTEQFSLFLGQGFVITFQERSGDCLEPVRARIRRKRQRISEGGCDYLAYAVLDAIVDSYFPMLEALTLELEGMEEEILADPDPSVVGRLHRVKRDMTHVRRILLPTREALNSLHRTESRWIRDSTQLYLRDCVDHTFQLLELLDSLRDLASGLRDLHMTIVSNRMNDIMKVLTIIATIFIPLSFIAGLYGMNFDPGASRWNLPELSWRYGYPYALGLMVLVGLGMLVFFRRKKWL